MVGLDDRLVADSDLLAAGDDSPGRGADQRRQAGPEALLGAGVALFEGLVRLRASDHWVCPI
ncbi:hypothetical protein [Nocardioides iriomotensis]|uniref:Uncharacterized protein n=1 Tax=Nocardioides iriomotensis TaxID=715784 RepID=A0A4Q5IY62_9ACTN|nr:hypothetical protein [Nocardioides iriomotensis]RYU09855.1 hypothetical protein ETU37_18610 [Nocardioides iriomotensis]